MYERDPVAAQFLIVSEDGLGELALDAAHRGGLAASAMESTDVALEQLRLGMAPVALDVRATGAETLSAPSAPITSWHAPP